MKQKFVFLVVVFIVLLISSIYITKHHIEREYKIESWGDNYDFEVTEFNVIPEENLSTNMFDTNFYIDVTIKGIARNELFPVFISHVHKSERFDTVDGKTVAVIEFSPVLSYKMFGIADGKIHEHTEKFRYKLKSYNYDKKTYIFKCGGFEKTISFHSGK